jgi:hypothetical protein
MEGGCHVGRTASASHVPGSVPWPLSGRPWRPNATRLSWWHKVSAPLHAAMAGPSRRAPTVHFGTTGVDPVALECARRTPSSASATAIMSGGCNIDR